MIRLARRTQRTTNPGSRRPRKRRITRRGVIGVLAMMFLVLFSTLALAMGIATQGNLRTAASHLRVTRALGAVDTGMGLASSRLSEAAARFVTTKGEMTPAYITSLWNDATGANPAATLLPPRDGRVETTSPNGIAAALKNLNKADSSANLVASNGSNAASAIATPTAPTGWVAFAPIGVETNGAGKIVTAVQITYAPPDAKGQVLAIVTGYDWDYARNRWVTRTAQQLFDIKKTVKHALLAPSRIMIGRDVQVDGPLGVRYDSHSLDTSDGPPLVIKSDFMGLNNTLDNKLRDFYTKVLSDDVDGDNRLRTKHPIEAAGLAALNAKDYNSDSVADNAFQDVTKDGFVDDFDIFLKHYDPSGTGRVVLSAALTAGTPAAGQTPMFTADDALALLIDGGMPDRNKNGRKNGRLVNGAWDYSTFKDNNNDGTIDNHDIDQDDITLGYRDGVLDYRDRYAKVRGSVSFKVARSAWESAKDDFNVVIGDYQKYVQGAIIPEKGRAPVQFGASDSELPNITDTSFAQATTDLLGVAATQNITFAQQVTSQGYTVSYRTEPTPYGAAAPADWYRRPVYQNLTFKNVTIPMGNNGLFINCTFIGVTRVQCYQNNTHASWAFYGQETRDPATGVLKLAFPPPPATSTAQLDQSYSTPGAPNYSSLPAPLYVTVDLNGDGTANDQCTNTKLVSNNIRFDGCTFVGSIVADKPTVFQNIRNKLVFTGATKFTDKNPSAPEDPSANPTAAEMEVIEKSSMMLPNYSVEIGTNNSPQSQDVRLQGAIIGGVLDIRGNAQIDGVLLGTFKPVYGTAPLSSYGTPVGNPANYNITLGYFGPADGDQEGLDLTTMTDLDGDGKKDIGWDTAHDSSGNLIPTAGWNGVQQDSWYDSAPDSDWQIAAAGTYVRRAIPFNGYGKVIVNWNPDLVLPDGLASPISAAAVKNSYVEGHHVTSTN